MSSHPPRSNRTPPFIGPQDEPPHNGAIPGRGYTVPIMGRRPPLPPPRNIFERIWRVIRRYLGLQRGAQTSSMLWWGLKIIQGVLVGLPLIVLGAALMVARPVLGSTQCVAGLGPVFLLVGILAMLWNFLAPVTSAWRVTIPAGEYWVVEDRHGQPFQFLGGGPQRVDWHMNVRLRRYVDFTRVETVVVIQDVLPAAGTRVDLEISAALHFEPHNAAPENYVELRKLTQIGPFEHMLRRAIHTAIREAFQRRPYDAQLDLLAHPEDIEQIVARAIAPLRAWGLFPFPDRPARVIIYGLPPYAARPAPRDRSQARQAGSGPGRGEQAAQAYRYDPAQVRQHPPQHATPEDDPPASDSHGDAADDADRAAASEPTRFGAQRSAENAERLKRRRERAELDRAPDRTSEDPMDRRSAEKDRRRGREEGT